MPGPLFRHPHEKRPDLPVVRYYWDHRRIMFQDQSIFTDENDHNPLVAARCPKCQGEGRWFEEDHRSHRDYMCRHCQGTGHVQTPVRLFENESPPVEVTTYADGWVKCPSCGWRFSTRDKTVWTGRRHRCGQRLVILNADADANR